VDIEAALQSQLRNIEAKTGRSVDEWRRVIRTSGKTRHGEIVGWLKSEHNLGHGAANRLALVYLEGDATPLSSGPPTSASLADELYAGPRQALLPIHRRLMDTIESFGGDIEVAAKKGYLSLRRRKQFAMIRPAAKHVDLGLILPGEPVTDRLESAATFNALFTHRVRVRSEADVDAQLTGWLAQAYEAGR
jgi:uncharacterized protein DUF5655/uncharacterized protein DUF4287